MHSRLILYLWVWGILLFLFACLFLLAVRPVPLSTRAVFHTAGRASNIAPLRLEFPLNEVHHEAIVEVVNVTMAGLLIVKTDSVTGKPIPGAVFDIKRADGQLVAGNILDGNQPNTANNSPNLSVGNNGVISGSFTTDANGRILINGLDAGLYTVTERTAPEGYALDTQVYNVTVLPGKLATLQLTNTPMGGIRLTKIDSITKKPIYNVEFMLFNNRNQVVGVFYTDNMGVIDFPTDITAGRYSIRETRAAAGYTLDEIPKTVEFVPGKVTEIVWSRPDRASKK